MLSWGTCARVTLRCPMSFDGWLDARDGETLARAWASLGATKVEMGVHPDMVLFFQPAGVAALAAAWLGCTPDRFAWFGKTELDDQKDLTLELDPGPEPTFQEGRMVTRCFLDGAVDVREACDEHFVLQEIREGARGVQLVTALYIIGPMTREGGNGGGARVLRLFDRSTGHGLSVQFPSREVYTIGGSFDLSPLDLFAHRVGYKLPWTTIELAAVRGFIAQLAADLDAHFDTSAEWEGGVTRDEVLVSYESNVRTRRRELRFASGPYAIELGENLDPDVVDAATSMCWVDVRGVSSGHRLGVRIALSGEPGEYPVDGWIDFRLPLAQLEAAVARAATIPGIKLEG